MKKFVSIFFKDKIDSTNVNMLTDFFKGLVGVNLSEDICGNVVSYVFDSDYQVDFKEIILSINADFYLAAKLYESKNFTSNDELLQYLQMIKKVKPTLVEEDYFTDDELVIKNLGDLSLIKKVILNKYVDDREMLAVIKAYLDCNMNVTQTANRCFMHRNTVMNKIERFIDVTGYDIKKFKKAFIIYHLIY